MATEAEREEYKDEAVKHLDKAKGEVDAAWSVLHGTDEGNACLLVDELGRRVDDVTDTIKQLGECLVECNVCHKGIKPGEPCYQLRQGGIEEDGVTFLPDEDVGYYHQLCMVGLP